MKSVTYSTILGLPVSIFGKQGRHGGGHISSGLLLGLGDVSAVADLKLSPYIQFLYVQETWKKSFMFPYHHGRNLFNQMKANTVAIWRGEELPEQNEKDKLYGHCIIFFETMSESLMQLCLSTLVLREFGLSPDRFEASNQISGLFSSLFSIILLFAKVRTKNI